MIGELALERARKILDELRRAEVEFTFGRPRSGRAILKSSILELERSIEQAARMLGKRPYV